MREEYVRVSHRKNRENVITAVKSAVCGDRDSRKRMGKIVQFLSKLARYRIGLWRFRRVLWGGGGSYISTVPGGVATGFLCPRGKPAPKVVVVIE